MLSLRARYEIYRYKKEETEEHPCASGIQTAGIQKKTGLIFTSFIKDNKIKFLNIPFKKSEIQVFDITGREVYNGVMDKEKTVIPFKKGAGAYILMIRDPETGKKIRKKLIKLR